MIGSAIGRRTFLAGLPLLAAGCVAPQVWADDDAVARAVYRSNEPPALTLFTMKNVGTDNGAHTGLLINASQRVVFDPAGTFHHDSLPERNDVIFGMTPQMVDFYRTYHARATYYVVEQYAPVTTAQAESALRLAMDYGPVPKAACSRSTANILRQVPGLIPFRPTLFPDNLMAQFARMPGLVTFEHREFDSDDKEEAVAAFDAQLAAEARQTAAASAITP